jgi:hypothetical protein
VYGREKMKIFIILLLFSNLIISNHNITFCKPGKYFCVSINGPKEINLRDGFPEYYLTIKNISGIDFKDNEVVFGFSSLGSYLWLEPIRFQGWLYDIDETDELNRFSCKSWKNGEERSFILKVRNVLFIAGVDTRKFLDNFFPIVFSFWYPNYAKGYEKFVYFVIVNSILPKNINGVEIKVEGPIFLTAGESAIFTVKIKNNSSKPIKKECGFPRLVIGFGDLILDTQNSEYIPDFESYEVVDKNIPNDYYIPDIRLGRPPYGYFEEIIFDMEDIMPGEEYYVKMKIKYRYKEVPYTSWQILNSVFCAFFLSAKKKIDYNTQDAMEFSDGKSIRIFYPLSDDDKRVTILNQELN